MDNLFDSLPPALSEELTETLAQNSCVRIEKIVSTGQASDEGFWYDQDEDEWVVVLKGQAKLLIDGEAEPRLMNPGDHLTISAHQKHRVAWTSPTEPTVWLAVFFSSQPEPNQ